MLRVWDFSYCFWLVGVFKIIIKRSYLLRTEVIQVSLLLCILNFSDCLPNRELLHFLQCSPTGPVKISHLELYTYTHTHVSMCMNIYLYLSIHPSSTQAATYCHLQICPQGPWNKSNKQVFLLSFLPKHFSYLSSRCWEGLHPFPLSRHQPVGEKKNGFNYIPNYFSSCLRP